MSKLVLSISAILCLALVTPSRAADVFTPTGSLTQARYHHTATLLSNGTVLVTGGRTRLQTTSTCELYNPAAGKWTATGSMITARAQHTATLLSNGKVIVVGGTSVQGPPPSIPELYNPATGTWAQTPAPPGASSGTSYRTVLLANGNLLAIWVTGTPYGTKAALYSVAENTWTETGAMNLRVPFPTLTLLPTGKLLAAGGFGANNTASSNAELYDPATGTWTATGPMKTGRFYHAAILVPNGQVLATGGHVTTSTSPLADSEFYDPSSGEWTVGAPLPRGHAFSDYIHLPNGKILLGYLYDDYSNLVLYNPVIGDFTYSGAEMKKIRDIYTRTLLPEGRILLAGGTVSANGYDSSATELSELYQPLTSLAQFNAWFGSTVSSQLSNGQRLNLRYNDSGKPLLAGDVVERKLILYNSGTKDLELGSIRIDGPSADEFSAAAPDAGTLPPGQSTSFTLTFKPTKARYPTSSTATIHLSSNDLEKSPFSLTLDGWVRSRTAEIGVQELLRDWREVPRILKDNGSVIRFGRLKTGRSVYKEYFITNEGGASLNKLSIKLVAKSDSSFSISKIRKTTLKTGQSTTIKVTFKPTSKGPKGATIQIKSNDKDENPFDIRISGLGSAP